MDDDPARSEVMLIERLSDVLLHDLDAATDDALGEVIAWSEAHGLGVDLRAVGEVRDGRVRWTLVVVAMRNELTDRWWEFPVDSRRSGPMRLLLLIELLVQLGEQGRRRTPGRPSNAGAVVGQA